MIEAAVVRTFVTEHVTSPLKKAGAEVMHENPLDTFRRQLDRLDDQIVELISQRLAVCENVARFKKAEQIPMMQPHRVDVVKQRAADKAKARGVDEQFIKRLYTLMIDEACRLEDVIIDSQAEEPAESL